ncbi:hypothetical protein KA005_29005, partial [bacterium]|nr:hypothetical protein [bacterium]
GEIIMPGGKGNIRPEDGKQFEPGNAAAEVWDQETADQLGNELLDWLEEKDDEGQDKGNIFVIDFLANREEYSDLPAYLADKFSSFSDLLKKAKTIQEAKLLKYGVADRLNSSMTKFCLINHHGYTDKQSMDLTTKGQPVNDIKFTVADPETIDKVQKLLRGDEPDKGI